MRRSDSLDRMLEQTNLEKVYNHYLNAYTTTYNQTQHWPKFNDFRLVRSLDGASCVYYTPETTLFGDHAKRLELGAMGKNIGQRLLDCASYFLAQGIAPDNVPQNLKICLAVCHNNVHWTGVEVTVEKFRDIYAELFAFQKSSRITFEGSEVEMQNHAKNMIYKKMGILLIKEFENDVILPESEKMAIVLQNFTKHEKVSVKHFDSMNSSSYDNAIKDSLNKVSKLIKYQSVVCGGQRGNTCGDHTNFNLFMSAVMNVVPAVNVKGALKSDDLRNLDIANPQVAVDFATTMIQSAKMKNPNDVDEIGLILKENEALNEINDYVRDLINKLHEVDKDTVTAIIWNAVADDKHHPLTYVDMSNKQANLFKELKSIFAGQHKIFENKGVDASRKIAYGLHAENFAIETCVGIEQLNILAAEAKLKALPQSSSAAPKKAEEAKRKAEADAKDKRQREAEDAKKKAIAEEAKRKAAMDEEAKRNAAADAEAKRQAAEQAKRDAIEAQAKREATDAQQKIEETFQSVLKNIFPDKVDKNVEDEVRKIIADKKIAIQANDTKIAKLALLAQYKHRKEAEIQALTFTNTYSTNLNEFYKNAVNILVSNEPEEEQNKALIKCAEKSFSHHHPVKRFFADVALVLSCIIGIGFYIGHKRLSAGRTFFKSSNTSLKQFENEVLQPKNKKKS